MLSSLVINFINIFKENNLYMFTGGKRKQQTLEMQSWRRRGFSELPRPPTGCLLFYKHAQVCQNG